VAVGECVYAWTGLLVNIAAYILRKFQDLIDPDHPVLE